VNQLRKALKRIPGARWLVRRLRYAFHPHYRAVRRAERERPGQLLQPEAATGAGRYPEIIAFVGRELAAQERPRVLSWGCSTGAELLALRKALPHADITGVDINARSLARARRAVSGDGAIRLVLSGDPAELAGEEFDAVLCLAVLRHARLEEERLSSCTAILPFAQAERFTASLTNLLRPGGLLALWNVHFRLADMATASRFSPVLELDRGRTANQPLYGPDDMRLDDAVCTVAVYRRG
jgi:2-polyprenyl-3-methyl-5-hydroxy-6-metoxy-1,4-benzoquinol methylase